MILVTIKERRKLEFSKISDQSVEKRFKYLWYYYKWHAIICIVLFVAIIGYFNAIINEPETVLNGLLLNSYSYSRYDTLERQVNKLVNTYFEQENITESQMQINLDTSRVYYVDGEDDSYNYDTLQLMLACTAAESLDFVTGDAVALIDLAYMQFFANLEDHLPEELMQKHNSDILYIDMAVVRQRERSLNNNIDDSSIIYPDATKPELMEEPVPVLICINGSVQLRDIYGPNFESIFFAFTSDDQTGNTFRFLRYLLKE